MSKTIGLTINEWKQLLYPKPDIIYNIIETHLLSLKKEDNSWIYIATYSQVVSQINLLFTICKNCPNKLPLFGIPFAVKDNIDVADWPTTAACPDFTFIAKNDAFVVAKLKSMGAIVIGKTNLDQYATGLVGTRSPYGIVSNTFNDKYISGGSSSGSASVLARGLVAFSLGTDTAGSGRIPAGFNNIIGFKPTKGWLSCSGIVPACRLNDTVSVFALTVEDAFTIVNAASGYDSSDVYSRMHPCTTPSNMKINPDFAIPSNPEFFNDFYARNAWEKTLNILKSIGVKLHQIDFTPFKKLAEQLYSGPWIAERTVSIGNMINYPEKMDPIVHQIVSDGLKYNAMETYIAEYMRAKITRQIQETLSQFDAMLVPTAPTIYSINEIKKQPIKYNSNLGLYTNFTNLADLSALTLPGPFRNDNLPFSITLISLAWHDRALANFGLSWQKKIKLPLGATGRVLYSIRKSKLKVSNATHIRLAVVGAHLTKMPLNYQLTNRKAIFIEEAKTANNYRLFVISDDLIKKPGLIRSKKGKSITVELWDMPLALLGEFMLDILPPLSIGNLILEDGRVVKGFLCEEIAINNALEITEFGGWRNWIDTQKWSD